MLRLYIIRHGESVVNLGNWDLLDTMDTELTERGRHQAEALGKWLKAVDAKGDVLYASTLRRARETASYVSAALDLQINVDDRLREVAHNFGTGHPIDELELPRSFIDQRGGVAPFLSRANLPENVESWAQFRVRVAQFTDMLVRQHLGQTAYVVAHGGVVAAMTENIMNIPPYRRCDIHSDNTGITYFEYDPQAEMTEPWYLRYLNRVDHLVWRG